MDRAVRRAVARVPGWPDPPPPLPPVIVERAQNPAHGDYSVTLPLKLAKTLHRSPMAIADDLASATELPPSFARVEVAPPGFINLRLETAWLQSQVDAIVAAGGAWGRGNLGDGLRVQVEFVSANPTGPLLFSHGRGAVVGDVAARILEASGFAVQREYYINDKGKQIRLFGESVRARMLGESAPEGGYSGEYLSEIV
ncbi:MAG: arginine--tRNA ligase, partial [Candidatus Dormibacteraeota bacterium]|nr:arginine--tRNA ligase [Candidatus Dormibacteraeota bacterium]